MQHQVKSLVLNLFSSLDPLYQLSGSHSTWLTLIMKCVLMTAWLQNSGNCPLWTRRQIRVRQHAFNDIYDTVNCSLLMHSLYKSDLNSLFHIRNSFEKCLPWMCFCQNTSVKHNLSPLTSKKPAWVTSSYTWVLLCHTKSWHVTIIILNSCMYWSPESHIVLSQWATCYIC